MAWKRRERGRTVREYARGERLAVSMLGSGKDGVSARSWEGELRGMAGMKPSRAWVMAVEMAVVVEVLVVGGGGER